MVVLLKKIQYKLYIGYSRVKVKKEGGYCPCCERYVTFWKPYGTRKLRFNAECPLCRAAERERAEILFIKNLNFNNKIVLHFAPEKSIFDFLSRTVKKMNYITADIEKSPYVNTIVDITKIPFEDSSIDYIICNHVLEHVDEHNCAIQELARVLKEDGICIITVPIDEKHITFQDNSIKTKEQKIKFYGEENHVRMYGKDFEDILSEFGLYAKKRYVHELIDKKTSAKMGLQAREYFFECKKYRIN